MKHNCEKAKAKPAPDSLDLLVDGQSEVRQLFRAFDQMPDDADPISKEHLARTICRKIYAQTKNV